ncbi:MAG: zinc protease, partial [Planctomycetota bacterium]
MQQHDPAPQRRSTARFALLLCGVSALALSSSCYLKVQAEENQRLHPDQGTAENVPDLMEEESDSQDAQQTLVGAQPISGSNRVRVVRGYEAARAMDPSAPSFEYERFTLDNGLEVVLHQDHSQPKVVVNTWFQVGSKDEEQGRTGFAHLFEHLMFMGTGRVPDNQFDVIMETGGGWNNASTSSDRTNYYSEGPSSLLPTLLWLDADRFEALDDYVTQEKLDSQRAVVRNERRQTSENVPYGKSSLVISELIYPVGHPYHHPVIGSHEDLEAAEVGDVVSFFRRWYVPENAKLVVTGDFEMAPTRALIEELYGSIPGKPLPARSLPADIEFEGVRSMVLTDNVEFPKLFLTWLAPAHFAPGDGEMDLIAAILSDGPSSRLYRRLVLETGLSQDVSAAQYSSKLGSTFHIDAMPAPGVDLDALKAEIMEVLATFIEEGPTEAELTRVKAQTEAAFLGRAENLGRRADAMNSYLAAFGTPDGFGLDLARWTAPDRAGVRNWAGRVLSPHHVDLRVYPEDSKPDNVLDTRPAAFNQPTFAAPKPESFTLPNGIAVHVLPRPGTGLFAGYAWFGGGEGLVARSNAGLSGLMARMLEAGAGGLDAASFAAEVETLGAQISVSPDNGGLIIQVNGLGSRLRETIAKFADVVLRPNLTSDDFDRERGLQLADIAARSDDPRSLSTLMAMELVFGADDARGRSTDGFQDTVEGLTHGNLSEAHRAMLHRGNMTLLFAGDFSVDQLLADLSSSFGTMEARGAQPVVTTDLIDAAETPGIRIIDRPGAPQTMIYLVRPVPNLEGLDRAVREALLTVFGGTFTSRLNANLREDKNYSYGAGASSSTRAFQEVMLARTAVFTDVTGLAMTQLKMEYDRLASGGIDAAEL